MIVHPNWPCTYSTIKEESLSSSNVEDENVIDDLLNTSLTLTDLDKLLISLITPSSISLNELFGEKQVDKLNKKLSTFSSKNFVLSLDQYIESLKHNEISKFDVT